jgi:hypothetical protein
VRILKIGLAIPLIIFAILTAYGELLWIRESLHDRAAHSWDSHATTILLFAMAAAAVQLLLRKQSDPVAGIHYPRCHALGGHTVATSFGRRTVSPMAFHFGGFFMSLFFSGSRQQRFRCRECGDLFHAHTPVSRSYRILFLCFVGLIAIYILRDILILWHSD